MVDGSHLSFEENIAFTKHIGYLARPKMMLVEAELGRLSGTEDDLTVEDYEAKLTDITQVIFNHNRLKLISVLVVEFPGFTDLVFLFSPMDIRLENLSIRRKLMP